MDGGLPNEVDDAEVRAAFVDVLREAPLDAPTAIQEQGPERADYIVLVSGAGSYTLGLGSWTIDGPSRDAMTAGLKRESDGSLRMTGWGGCRQLEVVAAPGRFRVEVTAPAGGVDRTTNAPVVMVTETDCTSGRDPSAFLGEPTVTEDDSRVVINLTSEAIVGGADCPGNPSVPLTLSLANPIGDRELYDGGTFPPTPIKLAGPASSSDDAWQTVTYEGDPVNESGDNRVLVDLPQGWERLDTSACEFAVPRFGLPANNPCEQASTLGFVGSSTYDSCCSPGLSGPEATSGDAFAGSVVAYVDAPDHETARRILASVRLPGDPAPSETWRTEDLGAATVEVPDDDSVDVAVLLVKTSDRAARTNAMVEPAGSWVSEVDPVVGTRVRITAPTQALADVVASTVRPATGGGWHTVSYDGEAQDAKGNAVTFEVPSGWDRLDSNLCRIAVPRFGPPGADPCEDDTVVSFYDVAAAYDDVPGLDGPDDTDGIKRLGDLVAYVDAPDHDTASRILESLRLAG